MGVDLPAFCLCKSAVQKRAVLGGWGEVFVREARGHSGALVCPFLGFGLASAGHCADLAHFRLSFLDHFLFSVLASGLKTDVVLLDWRERRQQLDCAWGRKRNRGGFQLARAHPRGDLCLGRAVPGDGGKHLYLRRAGARKPLSDRF